MARARTTAPDPPNACKNRAMMSTSIDQAKAQARPAEGKRREQYRLAAMTVGDWSIDDLAQGKANEIKRNRQLHARRAGRQLAPNVRQRRQIHIHGQRTDRRQQREHRRKRKSIRTQHDAPRTIGDVG